MEKRRNYKQFIKTLSDEFSDEKIIILTLQLFAWKKASERGTVISPHSFESFYHSEITWQELDNCFQHIRDTFDNKAFEQLTHHDIGDNVLKIGVNSISETEYPGYLAIVELVYNTTKLNRSEYAYYYCRSLFESLSTLIQQEEKGSIYELFPRDFTLPYSLIKKNGIEASTEGGGNEQIPALLRILEGLPIEHVQTDPIQHSPGYTEESASHILKRFDSAVVNLIPGPQELKGGIEVDPYNRFFFSDYQKLTIYSYIEHCLAHTRGRLFAIVRTRFLSRTISTERQFKRALVNRGMIEAVITLPQNIYPTPSVSASIIILNSKENPSGEVFFADATGEQFYRKEGRKNVIKPDALVSLIQERKDINGISRNVDPQEIHENEFSLIPQHYSIDSRYSKVDKFLSSFKEKGMLLDDVVEVIHPRYPSLEPEEDSPTAKVKYVTPQDIPEYGYISSAQEKQVKRKIITKGSYLLEPNDILLSIKGKVGIVGILSDDIGDDDWICARQFIALRLTSQKYFSPKALYMYLNSDVIQLMFEKLMIGTSLKVLQLKDIINIPIPVERKEDFEEKFDKAHQLYTQLEEIESKIQKTFTITS